MFTVSELFDLAVRVEENGERFYRNALDKTGRGSLRELLSWLAEQEVMHRKIFAEIKKRIEAKTQQDPTLLSLGSEVLRGAMGRHAFSLDELEIDSLRGEEEILRAALLFEEDTLLFFEFISTLVSDKDVRSMLETIKAEEVNHKQVLLDKIAEIQGCPA